MKKIIILGILILLLAVPSSLFADGMVIKPDKLKYWDYLDQDSQQAYINHKNGIEKIILGIDLEKTDKDAVWIFPVSSSPERVVVDVLTEIPKLEGYKIKKEAKIKLRDIKDFLYSTQIYPLFFSGLIIKGSPLSSLDFKEAPLEPLEVEGIEPDIIVHEHLEKEGMIVEVITAKSPEVLYKYLQDKNLIIEKGSIPVLDYYIGKDYTFIVSWMAPVEIELGKKVIITEVIEDSPADKAGLLKGDRILSLKLGEDAIQVTKAEDVYSFIQKHKGKEIILTIKRDEEIFEESVMSREFSPEDEGPLGIVIRELERKDDQKRGVFVTFPTDKIYYPLLLTSVYGSKTIPITIRVVGFVKPQVFKDIKNYLKTEYFLEEYYSIGDSDFDGFFDFPGDEENFKYTKITINAPSKMFTQDLWMKKGAPLSANFAYALVRYSFVFGLLIFILTSFFAGIFGGLVVFKEARKKRSSFLKFGYIGFFNLLSIIGLAIVIIFFRTKEIDKEKEKEFEEKGVPVAMIKAYKTQDKRKLIFLPVFSVFFLILTSLFIKFIQIIL